MENGTILFERGKHPSEYLIMFFQSIKRKKLNIEFRELFSHTSVILTNPSTKIQEILQTHPKNKVVFTRYVSSENELRRVYKSPVIPITDDENLHMYQQALIIKDFSKGYDYCSILFHLIQIITGKWIGPKKNRLNRMNCVKFVTYLFNSKNKFNPMFPEDYKMDMLDLDLSDHFKYI